MPDYRAARHAWPEAAGTLGTGRYAQIGPWPISCLLRTSGFFPTLFSDVSVSKSTDGGLTFANPDLDRVPDDPRYDQERKALHLLSDIHYC